jgi:hypothetical protein
MLTSPGIKGCIKEMQIKTTVRFHLTPARIAIIKNTREKVSSRRINLEGNTHVQEINASQLPV